MTERAARLVLASASPQRRAILRRLDLDFTVRPGQVEEIEQGADPEAIALQNALAKARASAASVAGERSQTPEVVVACDTVVWLEGQIHGKPADERAAHATLAALSARTHTVVSGVVVLAGSEQRQAAARTAVRFRCLDRSLRDWYVATGEWRGRAGGYAIQGAGAALVRWLRGDYENVVGLPLARLLDIYPQLLSFRRKAAGVR